MSTSMYVDEVKFRLRRDRFELAIQALKTVKGIDFPSFRVTNEGPGDFLLRLFRRNVLFDGCILPMMDLEAIWFMGDTCLSMHERFFQAIAKYVEAGSYISCQGGEEWSFWQWYFNGDCMIEKTGRIIFE